MMHRLQLGTFEKEDWLYRALNGHTIVFDKNMCNKLTTMTYGADVAVKICHLIGKELALGEAYHIATDEPLSWGQVINKYCDILELKLGYRAKVIFSDDIIKLLDITSGQYQIKYDRMFDRKFNCNKINSFDMDGEYSSFDNSISKCIDQFICDPKFNSINWKNHALMDRFAKEKMSLKAISGCKNKVIYYAYRYINKNVAKIMIKVMSVVIGTINKIYEKICK